MSGQRVGYKRVSTDDQSLERQLEGVPLDRVFTDHASGGSKERPGLDAMLLHVREGDTVIVHSIDRLARNLGDLRELVNGLVGRSVRVEFVTEALTFTGDDSPISTMLLSVMGALAEFERAIIRERGRYKGKPKRLTPERAEELRRRARQPGVRKAALAREFGIAPSTLYSYLQEATA